MEIWGGIECSLNKVGTSYFNQLDYQGHYHRKEDPSLIANLGFKKLRYPVLWEKHQPKQNEPINWGIIGHNLNYLRENGITVIAGLVHHGSGPDYVSLLDDSFAEGLANYATAVATNFPWIDYYTPVNEPLTTARFCGLYGLWYPHFKDTSSFLKILTTECKATIMAMEAIRKINPGAKLVLTEDLGKIHSTSLLRYQADFENERRWLSIDLICGKVNKSHPLFQFICDHGVTTADLEYFNAHAMPPDVLGFNYYITSERYLDENLQHYPAHCHGGNDQHHYADVEAVRCSDVTPAGLKTLLTEAWQRFKLPLAVTEAHLHCGREDQLRWLMEVYEELLVLEKEGINIQALTIWSLFGAFGWDQLLTTRKGNYESGVFDLRSGFPRATVLAQMVRHLARGTCFLHPLATGVGWWKRDNRVIYPKKLASADFSATAHCAPVLIIGARGTLGNAFARICQMRNIHYKLFTREELDLNQPAQIETVIQKYHPWAIINAAGFVKVDEAELEKEACFLSNTSGPVDLAKVCGNYGVKLMTFSSDLVFDGEKKTPYVEIDRVNPLNVYGESKAQAEVLVLNENPDALVIRTSAFFSPWDSYNFVTNLITGLNIQQEVKVASDVFISPTYVPDLVNVSLDLLIDDECGIWHLTNDGALSWYDFAQEIAERGKYNLSCVIPLPISDFRYAAKRPGYSVLSSIHGIMLPSLNHALDRLFKEKRWRQTYLYASA